MGLNSWYNFECVVQIGLNVALSLLSLRFLKENGAPGEIRTPDRLVRSQVLYPTELRALIKDQKNAGFSVVLSEILLTVQGEPCISVTGDGGKTIMEALSKDT